MEHTLRWVNEDIFVSEFLERWKERHSEDRAWLCRKSLEVYKTLSAKEKLTAKDIHDTIGNDSRTVFYCDICDQERSEGIEISSERYIDSQNICSDCLKQLDKVKRI